MVNIDYCHGKGNFETNCALDMSGSWKGCIQHVCMYVHVESSLDPIREDPPPSVHLVRNRLCYYYTIYPHTKVVHKRCQESQCCLEALLRVTTLKLLGLNGLE